MVKKLRECAHILLSGAGHRAELAVVEVAEAREAVTVFALLAAGGACLLLLGAATVTAFVAAVFWDSPYRLVALAALAALHLALGAGCLSLLRRKFSTWHPFGEVSNQLSKDLTCLKQILGKN